MDDLTNTLIMQAPNFIGFIVGYLILMRVNGNLQASNDRLIDAIIKRENCDETPTA